MSTTGMLGEVVKKVVKISESNPALTGLLLDFLDKINSLEGWSYRNQFERFLRREPTWIKPTIKNFRLLGSISVKPIYSPELIPYFRQSFGDMLDDVDETPNKYNRAMNKTTVRYANFKGFYDEETMIAHMGGETKVETTVSIILALIVGNEKTHALSKNRVNIFFVRDNHGVLRTVHVSRYLCQGYYENIRGDSIDKWAWAVDVQDVKTSRLCWIGTYEPGEGEKYRFFYRK